MMKQAIAITATIFALSAAHAAAEPVRQLGPHQHGHGTLNLAIEGQTVQIALEAPGADIVGFEHEAETSNDKAKVEAAEATLAQPLALFVFPGNAGCEVSSAKIALARESNEDHDAHEHEDEAEAGRHEAEHSAFHAEYVLTCANTGAITTISFPYFDAFPNSEELVVTLITERSQKEFEVNREHALIDIRGMM